MAKYMTTKCLARHTTANCLATYTTANRYSQLFRQANDSKQFGDERNRQLFDQVHSIRQPAVWLDVRQLPIIQLFGYYDSQLRAVVNCSLC